MGQKGNFLIDPISGSRISIPSDWLVCELKKIKNFTYTKRLLALQFIDPNYNSLSEGLDIYLMGFPKSFSMINFHYVAPTFLISEYKKVIKSLCVSRKSLICTKGKKIKLGEMICISAISCNGMSGGPALVKIGEEFKLFGILFGGPASPIHLLCAKIIRAKESKIKLLRELKKLLEMIRSKSK